MPPEDELSDEVPLSDENEAAASSSDSGVHFATDGADEVLPIAAEAPDEDPYAYQDYDGPTEDLASELADDAGDEASYGYDAASETARFDRAEVDPGLLSDSVSNPDESDKYRLVQTDSSEDVAASFAEDAGAAPGDDATYEEAPVAAPGDDDGDGDAYASHHPDMDGSSDETVMADEGYAEAQPEDEEPVAQGFTVEEEEAPAAQGFSVEEEAPAPAAPTSVAASSGTVSGTVTSPGTDAGRDDARPGQVRKSAIDEMFARAAELKRQKGR